MHFFNLVVSAYALLLVVLTHYKKLRFSFFVLFGGIYGAFFFQKKREHTNTQTQYGARPSGGHYTDSRYARDQSSATHLKFFFCIVVLRTTSSSAYALLLVVLTHYKKLRFLH